MSVLYYDIPIEERLEDANGNLIEYYDKELPHHKQIKDEFPSLVEDARLINGFEKNVQSLILNIHGTIRRTSDRKTVARIHIRFHPDIRLTSRIREVVFETMDAQMTDGFGEVLSHRSIANAEHAYYEI